ncbi:plasminogen activator inhibitor 1 RNA-binding -like [Micractinium conductrix]|uniref:Plasminogen activator inhibitor 1 RNA-binding -like n=1 Tax=Micractinium conductrix TaxID=554055 RepID=A0A2P6V7F8_9CHLO|nr:plasminogen activator inhibitor 1 RNA-binding -like [Micractinium conductrix]|eukprot:PSC70024.1 plasminogen activator inhibitor 1 RNA-binding -like [Micractinium conductrix]
MDSPKGVSKDLQRHVGDYTHHVERSKDQRMDRQDGTGRGHEGVKKGGAGKGNWGLATDDVVEDMPEDEADAGPAAVSPRDFVDNDEVKTLDEYEALKAKA